VPGAPTTTTIPGATTSTANPPLAEAAVDAFALDIEGLIAQLFAPETPADSVGDEVTHAGPGIGAPLAAGPTEEAAGGEDDRGSSRAGNSSATGVGFQLPSFGIWVLWLGVILAGAALVLVGDEMRRRRGS
jgi:hypothetical protein